ncbi:MAG: glycoside hydrolase family 9 protein [Tannerellaceae bacterium]|jgi:hypothetical protein|nr:glycoside hydrolase family 9 protein [Tannerellaceae bacterium]
MKRISVTIIILFLLCCHTGAQVDGKLRNDVRSTGFVHSPLPLDYSKSFETFGLTKQVLLSDMLCDMEDMTSWSHRGIGAMEQTADRSKSGRHSLRLTAPVTAAELPTWGLGLGTSMATYDVGGANWEKYNRIMFYIYPDCEGARSIYLNLYVENDGEVKVPDKYGREGYHEVNLINHQWNRCFVEMSELPRDKVGRLMFAIEIFGREETMGDFFQYDIDAVELQTIADPEVVSGWQPAEGRIIHSTTGYRPDSEKSALIKTTGRDRKFELVDYTTNRVVFEGDIKEEKTAIGTFGTAVFTDFRGEGRYYLRTDGGVRTQPFYIDRNVWDDSAWRVLNFMFCERCGYPVPGKHATCHTDLNGEHDGHAFTVNGGWHDAGDMAQQTLQTGEIAYAFFEMAGKAKEKNNTDLYLRLQEEALWGLDFILKTRFGDGYRMQSWGTNLWTDGMIGTIDDAGRRQVRVHNGGFENFSFAAIEAYASLSVDADKDPRLKERLAKIAGEDFAFALERFEELGYNERYRSGHAYMASQSQYMATVSWAASLIYKVTGDKYYADKAAEYIRYTIACQRTEPLGDKDGTRGFFYRDLDKRSIVHYNHQSRDQVYMQALTALCETQPGHADYKTWEGSIRIYGDYLKNIMRYIRPYGMMPSGVYHIDEVRDSANFYVVHTWLQGDADADYREQLENGIKLDREHYLRFFPVWFSFKGNAAVHLATGKAAALCGKFLGDKELLDIAEQQLFWIVGKNPFGQSLIYGEGSNYAQQYCALPGEMVGEIPVGMQSRFNEDTPYWPQFNTATYKEVWGSSAGKWISLISEF